MKNIQKALLLMTFPFLLSGCVKSINSEQFNEKFATVEANFDNDETFPKRLHINTKNNTRTYDYKEGEYYRHTTWALIILVPVTSNTSTWTQDGKYYYYNKTEFSSNPEFREITKEQFDSYMTAGLATIKNSFANPINKAKELMSYDNENSESEDSSIIREYKTVENKYSTKGSQITIRSDATPNVEGSETIHFTIDFTNGYPSRYYSVVGKNGNEENITYKVNYSQFNPPVDPNSQTSEDVSE